jgi:hypothetical protein
MLAKLSPDVIYRICLTTAPICLAWAIWDMFDGIAWWSGSAVAAYVWIVLALAFVVRNGNRRRTLILAALLPIACGLQLALVSLAQIWKMWGFAP